MFLKGKGTRIYNCFFSFLLLYVCMSLPLKDVLRSAHLEILEFPIASAY